MQIPEILQNKLNNLVIVAKQSLGDAKNTALPQAWKILQLMVAEIIITIESQFTSLSGKDKKTIAMDCVSQFYDSVFVTVTVPFIPVFLQPIIFKYVKALIMLLISSTIDALVTTFRNTGIFVDPSNNTEVKL